jgi:hypothetical protein
MRGRLWVLLLALGASLAVACGAPHPKTQDTPEYSSVVGFVAVYDEHDELVPPNEAPWWPMEVDVDGEDLDQHPVRDVTTGATLPRQIKTFTNPFPYVWTWYSGEAGYVSIRGFMDHTKPGWHMECWFERNGQEVSGTGDGTLNDRAHRETFPIGPLFRNQGTSLEIDCIYHLHR